MCFSSLKQTKIQVPARQEKRSLCAGAGFEICFRVLFGVLCVCTEFRFIWDDPPLTNS